MLSKKFIASFLVIIILLCGGLYFFALLNQKEKRIYNNITTNVGSSWVSGKNIYFYTGTYFAKYKTDKNVLETLSKPLFIQGSLDSLSWSDDSVIFQSNSQSNNTDDITTSLKQNGKDPFTPYWWRYDFSKNQYQLLSFAEKCRAVTLITPSSLGCIYDGDLGLTSSRVSIFNEKNGVFKESQVIKSDNVITDLSFDNNNLLYIEKTLGETSLLKALNIANNKKKTLYTSNDHTIESYVQKDNLVALKLLHNEDNVDGETDHSHESSSNSPVKQKIVVVKNGVVLAEKDMNVPYLRLYLDESINISSLDGSFYRINNNKGSIEQFYRPSEYVEPSGSNLFTINAQIYNINPSRELETTREDYRPVSKKSPSSYNLTSDGDPSGKSVFLEEKNGIFPVYLLDNTKSIQTQQETVSQLLSKRGFSPTEFTFRWTLGSGVDVALIQPNTVILSKED